MQTVESYRPWSATVSDVNPRRAVLRIDLDSSNWLFAENDDRPTRLRRIEHWRQSAAHDERLDDAMLVWLESTLETLAPSHPDELVAVHLPSIAASPTVSRVRFMTDTSSDKIDLSEVARRSLGETVEPPKIESHATAQLGTGVRAVGFRMRGPGRELDGSLAFAFRSDPIVVSVLCVNSDFGALARNASAVMEFIDAISIAQTDEEVPD